MSAVGADASLGPEDLLHQADLAMYRSKRDGGHRLAFCDGARPST